MTIRVVRNTVALHPQKLQMLHYLPLSHDYTGICSGVHSLLNLMFSVLNNNTVIGSPMLGEQTNLSKLNKLTLVIMVYNSS